MKTVVNKQALYATLLGAFTTLLISSAFVSADAANHGAKGMTSFSVASYNKASFDGQDFSSVNKSLEVSDGKSIENATSVNGSITIGNQVVAGKLSSVNGRIRIGENVSASEISTVNGKISAADGLIVAEEVSSVNGAIVLSPRSQVDGKIKTVNGVIRLNNVTVADNVQTINGSVFLSDTTVIEGDIIFGAKQSQNNYQGPDPTLSIDNSSVVKGKIILRRPVDLEIENSDLLNKVITDF